MADEKNPYLDTIDRLEPDIASVDEPASLASIAISLKRIADALDDARPIVKKIVEKLGPVLGLEPDPKA